MKKLTAVILALSLLPMTLLACVGENGTTSTTDDVEAAVTPEVDETTDFTTDEVTTEVVVSENGYDRGYADGKNGTGKQVAFGLDISEHQGANFDFKGVKAAGYDFVILRAGHVKFKDKYFEANYAAAREAGLDIGVYFYSYAKSVSDVKKELALYLEYIEGKTFEYPVFFDFENGDTKSAIGSNAATAKKMIYTMLDGLAKEGYLAGFYSYASWCDHAYNGWLADATDEIGKKYEVWMACYGKNNGTMAVSTARRYSTIYGMHQFTSANNTQPFYGGNLDTDVCFKDYPSIVKAYGFNGYEAVGIDNVTIKEGTEFEAQETENIVLDTSAAGKYYINTSSSPLNVRSGPGTGYDVLGSLDKGTEVTVIGTYNGWGKIEYKGQEGWISMSYAAPKN
ncbi:MAG: GH25 family lysozyme [Eubacteriales bacterium]